MNQTIRNYYDRLPYLVHPDHVAHYENGVVSMLDRREYPFKKETVICRNYRETAQAVTDMVTQSGGPPFVVSCGMTQAAYECRNQTKDQQMDYLTEACRVLGNARPTANEILYQARHMLSAAKEALEKDRNVEEVMKEEIAKLWARNTQISMNYGVYAANLMHDGDTIMTHCWAEEAIVAAVLAAQDQGKQIKAYCSETRPYLQGARLTADAISELGVSTTVITDNMPGYVISQGKVNVFFAGTDRVTRDGHVVNKVGTLQDALCCKYYNVPCYVFSMGPDPNTFTADDVPVEERNPQEVLECMGIRTATENSNVKGYYPAFDITPPELVTGIITDKGIFKPEEIEKYLVC